MDFEKFIYELKPFLCVAVAIYALLLPNPSVVVVVCAILLIAAGALILRARMKARSKGQGLEQFFYEFQPFIYIGLAAYALITQRSSKLAVISSLVLFFCAAVILKWRAQYRK